MVSRSIALIAANLVIIRVRVLKSSRHRRFFFAFGVLFAGTAAIAVFSSAEVAFVFLRDSSN